MSLTSAKLTNLDLTNCGQLYSLSFPELDQALSQQLVSSVAAAPNKTQSKVNQKQLLVGGLTKHCGLLIALLAFASAHIKLPEVQAVRWPPVFHEMSCSLHGAV